jgi:hypothetical protein
MKYFVREIKSGLIEQAKNAACMGERRNSLKKNFVLNIEGQRKTGEWHSNFSYKLRCVGVKCI